MQEKRSCRSIYLSDRKHVMQVATRCSQYDHIDDQVESSMRDLCVLHIDNLLASDNVSLLAQRLETLSAHLQVSPSNTIWFVRHTNFSCVMESLGHFLSAAPPLAELLPLLLSIFDILINVSDYQSDLSSESALNKSLDILTQIEFAPPILVEKVLWYLSNAIAEGGEIRDLFVALGGPAALCSVCGYLLSDSRVIQLRGIAENYLWVVRNYCQNIPAVTDEDFSCLVGPLCCLLGTLAGQLRGLHASAAAEQHNLQLVQMLQLLIQSLHCLSCSDDSAVTMNNLDAWRLLADILIHCPLFLRSSALSVVYSILRQLVLSGPDSLISKEFAAPDFMQALVRILATSTPDVAASAIDLLVAMITVFDSFVCDILRTDIVSWCVKGLRSSSSQLQRSTLRFLKALLQSAALRSVESIPYCCISTAVLQFLRDNTPDNAQQSFQSTLDCLLVLQHLLESDSSERICQTLLENGFSAILETLCMSPHLNVFTTATQIQASFFSPVKF